MTILFMKQDCFGLFAKNPKDTSWQCKLQCLFCAIIVRGNQTVAPTVLGTS